MRLWYDGARFKGYQRQPNLPSVQEALEGALARSGVRTSIAAAARTDAGVHALSQVVSFATRADLDPEWLRRSVNSALPDGIAVLEAFAVPKSFHARASARSRTYVYLVGVELPEPLRPYAWSLPDRRAFKDLALPSLDREALQAALTLALGDHDFTGFARPGASRERSTGSFAPRCTRRALPRSTLSCSRERDSSGPWSATWSAPRSPRASASPPPSGWRRSWRRALATGEFVRPPGDSHLLG